MVSLAGQKGVIAGLLTAVAYASMIIDIIQIVKIHGNRSNDYKYGPAVVAMLVAAILQFVYHLLYMARGGKGAMFKASTIIAAVFFFFLFQLGSVIAFTILRHRARYCPRDATNFGDCNGVTRGCMGLGYSLVGLDIIYAIYLAILVKKHGHWSTDLANIPEIKEANADLNEKSGH